MQNTKLLNRQMFKNSILIESVQNRTATSEFQISIQYVCQINFIDITS